LLKVETLAPEIVALAGTSPTISPTLTLMVTPTTVKPGDTVILSGRLGIGREYGDINGDGKINLKDYYTVALAYGSSPGDPRWNPDADINGDGVINLKDIYTVALRYGQTAEIKPIEIYSSSDGVNWSKIATVTTSDEARYSFNYPVPSGTPTPSIIYFKAYFPGGFY